MKKKMPLVRSECLLMTSFTNNKPRNQEGKLTAQQDLSFIPVRQCTETKKTEEEQKKGKLKRRTIKKEGTQDEKEVEKELVKTESEKSRDNELEK